MPSTYNPYPYAPKPTYDFGGTTYAPNYGVQQLPPAKNLSDKIGGGLNNVAGGLGTLGNIGKFAGVAGKLKSATPWGLGGTAASMVGGLVGKRNYKTGGAIGGAGRGAATGAMIGSVVPGIGTAVGGIVGGLIGGVKGFLSGRKRKEQNRQLMLQRQAEEDAQMFSNLQGAYGGGRINQGSGMASTAAQRYLNQQSRADQAEILKSFGNRDALEEWYQNARTAGAVR